MTEINNARWTSDHLLKPGGTKMYADQQRLRLRQMADEVQALLREYRSDLENMKFDGDKPLQARIRAYLASRPLAQLESDLRDAVNNVGKLDPEFQRRYVEIPEKRERAAEKKELEKAQKQGLNTARSMNTAGQLNGLTNSLTDTDGDEKGVTAKSGTGGDGSTFLDYLEKRA
ncbi:hypothetical protein [Streptomyces scabiei]|uniref:hypothetical protein n=1 Tax=Streptomyces scabiei TaxID=1930 RepID=UPI0004E78627|nr:hypothetical protein [Streptomyces scabiei]KFG06929.1 hypothetical protein IQ61_22155 [Streptomyces scabiei]MDX2835476.1 hypothetical protein [Streptomyces scabiei]MDX3680480.1 hypothetical protein [Streptomyces scabiei]